MKGWTYTTAIFKSSHLNTLKVVAVGTSLKFYINNILVWRGIDSTLSIGHVGVEMYRNSSSTGNKLYIDWANMVIPGEILSLDNETVAPGTEVSGGSKNQSP